MVHAFRCFRPGKKGFFFKHSDVARLAQFAFRVEDCINQHNAIIFDEISDMIQQVCVGIGKCDIRRQCCRIPVQQFHHPGPKTIISAQRISQPYYECLLPFGQFLHFFSPPGQSEAGQ